MQVYVLDNTVRKPPKKKQSQFSNVIRKFHQLKKCKLQYGNFMRLHEMWKQYMRSAVGGSSDARILKADLHGCILHVTKAYNSSQEGLYGIVVRESRNTFLLIREKENRLVTIPKQGSVFHFALDGRVYTIYGDNFRSTAAGRVQKKYKPNATIPDFFDSY